MFYILSIFLALASTKKKYNIIVDSDQGGSESILNMLGNEDLVLKTTRVGYTLELSEETAKKLKKHRHVKYIEEDMKVEMATFRFARDNSEYGHRLHGRSYSKGSPYSKSHEKPYIKMPSLWLTDNSKFESLRFILQRNAPWGLSRITGHIDSYEYIEQGGKDVIVYILDTGVDESNPEFEGRAEMKYNTIDGTPMRDEQGHGTHCAGTIGSRTYGVAKAARLVGVKVLDKRGVGAVSYLLAGIDYVIEDYLTRLEEYEGGRGRFSRRPAAVVNMSIGGGKSTVLNYLVMRASEKYGIHFSTAAGNEHKDACGFSPSSSVSLTTGATTRADGVARFSNDGACVDVYAPGVGIESTWLNHETRLASGTSMAAPHVSGMMAVYLSLADFTPEELRRRIQMDSELVVGGGEFWGILGAKKGLASFKRLYERLKVMRRWEY